ncbi:cysteine dioxygenase [Streptantibioticus silvisoli]|jgi:hypothetical protein|uniref:Cysteine dioxygenase n=1 Tax=Streptantibioticus silvisoli TaxID=2705255 RepID=A0ABT6WB60_9ACTN|nr:cysteine dioxygenase [Streptantibioticus silvisoli]MDI5967738.1 cysteine dioxygenase [Streptantibioticus silvisoli]
MSVSLPTPAPAVSVPPLRNAAAPARTPVTTVAPPTPEQLLAFVRRTAADPELVGRLPLDPEGRTWIRLEGPGGSEAWLIGWPPGAETGWHDHGGSHGAFATAAGELREESVAVPLPTSGWQSLELATDVDRTRHLPAGRSRAFGTHHVHQVVNASEERHAVSVHAYYPPLPLMRRYSRRGQTLRLELVERPEAW